MKSTIKLIPGLFLVAAAAITVSGCAAPPPPPPEVHHVYHTVYREAPSSPSDATVVNQYDRQSR